MFNRVMLVALISVLLLSLAGCGEQPQQQASQPAAAPVAPAKAPEPPVEIYELTKDNVTNHKDWTSRNISILGVKLGDRTREVEKNLGKMENTRTSAEDYLTIYQNQGLFVYTFKPTGKARKFEVNTNFAKQVADEKLRRLLTSGDLKLMREILGQEEKIDQTDEEDGTKGSEYAYDARGLRFIKYTLPGGKVLYTLRMSEVKRSTT